jgi:hypothetical protein
MASHSRYMSHPLFEQFLNPGSMLEAEQALLRLGRDALPVLESLFTGDAKNQFGVPLSKVGFTVGLRVGSRASDGGARTRK